MGPRPRLNPNHVGSSKYNREVMINRKAYLESLNYKDVKLVTRIVDVLDEETFNEFESMKGVVCMWLHTYDGHTIQITPIEASRLLKNGVGGVSVKICLS